MVNKQRKLRDLMGSQVASERKSLFVDDENKIRG